jgi:proline iminopeptidase
MMNRREGYVEVTGGHVWYEVVGEGDAVPLVCLHGGPGSPHDGFEMLADLAVDRQVVFYDQLGCGNSERPTDKSLWVRERFVEELCQVRQALGLDKMHLLGHSWGTMLAADYLVTKQPDGVLSVVFSSPCISIPMWMADARRLVSQMPAEVRQAIEKHEAAGTVDSEEYAWATAEYYNCHVCQAKPLPVARLRSRYKMGWPVYNTMWGPNEFNMTGGNLIDFDRTPDLPAIKIPALWTCGRHDEATPETTAYYHSLMPGSEFAVFEGCSHSAFLEDRQKYMLVIHDFLEKVEAGLK